MTKIHKKSVKAIVETDLNFQNLWETTYCLLRAYITWIYISFLRITRIRLFLNLVNKIICNINARINNNYSQRKNLLQWIKTKVKPPIYVTNFGDDWKNGIALCALMEALIPGSCPRYDLLNPDLAFENLNLGLLLVKKHLNINSPIESQEIHDCNEEAKLVYLLSRIKFESVKLFMKSLIKRPIINVMDSQGNNQKMFETLFGDQKACFAKGMGLILGVRTRRARFNIFCRPSPKLNLMIEISGPDKTMCSERICVHSLKKRVSADVITSSVIADYLKSKKTPEEVLKIPFFYEVLSDRIVITYIPLETGIHKLSIIWQGQHILESPYTVRVEECKIGKDLELDPSNTIARSPTRFTPGLQWPVPSSARNDTLSLEDCATVVRRKVIKQTVIKNGITEEITDFHINSDNFNDKSKEENYFGVQNEFNSERSSDQISLDSKKLEKLLINDFNNRNLFDIKESDSIETLKLDSNDIIEKQNNQCTDCSDASQELDFNKRKISDDLSNSFQTNSIPESLNEIHLNEEFIITDIEQTVSKPVNYMNQNIVNNIKHRSYIPVKNMIQNWELKLSKNTNEFNERQNKISSDFKSKIPCILVKNRRELFEKNILYQSNSSSSVSNSTIGSSIKNEKQSLNTPINNNNNNNDNNIKQNDKPEEQKILILINDVNQNSDSDEDNHKSDPILIKKEIDLKTPESQADSGIHLFPDKNNLFVNRKLLRRKSLSSPNLRELDDQYFNDFKNSDCDQTLISGQYIDDEIPDYSNLFMDQYVSYTGLIKNQNPINFDKIQFKNIFDAENDLNSNKEQNIANDLGIYPEKCEVFGAGTYYGHVGVANQFVVSTKDSGKSYLSVGVQSVDPNDVLEVSFTSIGSNRYQVQYKVSRPGYYVIFVKWGDFNIADSPFICKVTY